MKAQIQMGETIAILIIFMLFVGFGLMFYSKIAQSSFDSKKAENLQLQAVQIAQRAAFLPEIQCSEANTEENCIDILKLNKAAEIISNNKGHYYDAFRLAKITINETFPTINGINKVLYSEVPSNILQKDSTFIPITLKDYQHKKAYFGIMTVEVYVTK